jgi:hypothetical protein
VGANGFPADTYLATHGWSKGIAWVNGFNLGWFWPAVGPQMTLYVPGPVLRPGDNELVLLEVERPPAEAAGDGAPTHGWQADVRGGRFGPGCPGPARHCLGRQRSQPAAVCNPGHPQHVLATFPLSLQSC